MRHRSKNQMKTYGKAKLTIDQMFPERKQAKAIGHTHYFTGVLCKNGHLAPRRVKTSLCMECEKMFRRRYYVPKPRSPKLSEEEREERRKSYALKYWKKNKELIKKRSSEWRKNHKEQERQRNKRRYAENSKGFIEKAKTYYQENREIMLEKKQEYRANNKDKIREQNRRYYLKKKKEKEES